MRTADEWAGRSATEELAAAKAARAEQVARADAPRLEAERRAAAWVAEKTARETAERAAAFAAVRQFNHDLIRAEFGYQPKGRWHDQYMQELRTAIKRGFHPPGLSLIGVEFYGMDWPG